MGATRAPELLSLPLPVQPGGVRLIMIAGPNAVFDKGICSACFCWPYESGKRVRHGPAWLSATC